MCNKGEKKKKKESSGGSISQQAAMPLSLVVCSRQQQARWSLSTKLCMGTSELTLGSTARQHLPAVYTSVGDKAPRVTTIAEHCCLDPLHHLHARFELLSPIAKVLSMSVFLATQILTARLSLVRVQIARLMYIIVCITYLISIIMIQCYVGRVYKETSSSSVRRAATTADCATTTSSKMAADAYLTTYWLLSSIAVTLAEVAARAGVHSGATSSHYEAQNDLAIEPPRATLFD